VGVLVAGAAFAACTHGPALPELRSPVEWPHGVAADGEPMLAALRDAAAWTTAAASIEAAQALVADDCAHPALRWYWVCNVGQ
jgi:hypothetical protein